MPLMALCAVVVLVRVMTLGTPDPAHPEQNVLNGLGFMWNPKTPDADSSWVAQLFKPSVWLAAAGQIFFSLSVGFGVVINYASYLRRSDDIVLSGLTASATNEFFEVGLGGLITIPAAFVFLGATGAVGGTFGLGFNTLPVVFLYMPGGRFFGCIWFFMLFLAAITSSLSMLQPAIAFLEEALNIGRKASVALLGIVTSMGSLFVIYFSKDLLALDTLDYWIGTFLIVVLAALQVILFSWVFGVDKGIRFANQGSEMKLPRAFWFVIQFVSPLYLLAMLTAFCINDLPGKLRDVASRPVATMSVALIFAITIGLLLLITIAGPRWKAETQDTSERGR
jgi:SNF family Na+-dependent transporter